MRMRLAVPIVLIITSGSTQALFAQVDAGSISGTVRDSSGAVIPSAVVKVTGMATGGTLSLATNADGFYSVPALRPGNYQVSASAPGFATQTKTDIGLRVQDRLTVDLSLSPGQA